MALSKTMTGVLKTVFGYLADNGQLIPSQVLRVNINDRITWNACCELQHMGIVSMKHTDINKVYDVSKRST